MFAVVIGCLVSLYGSYSHELVGSLENNAPITAVWWGPFDQSIHCGAADGMTYAWQIQGLRRVHEHRTFHGVPIVGVAVLTDSECQCGGTLRLRSSPKDGVKEHREGERFNMVAIGGESTLRHIQQTILPEQVRQSRAGRSG